MLLAVALLRGLAPALAAAAVVGKCNGGEKQQRGNAAVGTCNGPHGQERWAEGYPACGGRAQSPIDIETRRAQPDPSLPPLRPQGSGAGAWGLANNGHTVALALPPALTLHGLPRTFAAAQLHFHWGRRGRPGGSEHLLDGQPAPAEMHVVHYDAERFADASEAQQHAGGLAVLAVLLEAGAEPNPAYDNILRHLDSVRYAGQKTSIPSFSLRDLLPERLDRYFRYNGSLTTPPCFQSVLWTVFEQRVRISSAQLEQLQGALYATTAEQPSPELLVDNFRAPQSLNQRLVLSSVPVGPAGYTAGEVVAIVFGIIFGCLGLFLAIYFVVKRMRAKRTQAQDVVFKSSTRRATPDDGHRLRAGL
ncbi:carbonic anhydrase 14 [Struthio camelus]|uniref:carbonic anhydrase 14 n=1 Tax=Struthio camelus TaxID=8801 RepID=UPI003603F952